MYSFWRQRPQQLQRVALQNSAFHHSTSCFSSSYNTLNRLFHFLIPKKQYTPNTIHSPLAMFCNRFSMSLHLLHPELTATSSAILIAFRGCGIILVNARESVVKLLRTDNTYAMPI